MSKTIVKYGEFDFNNQPTPFLTRSETFIKQGENWGSTEAFTLRGQITGCDFEEVRSYQKDLISGFSKDFQNLEVFDREGLTDNSLFFVSGLKVESINFPQNKYTRLLDYDIQLTHYPSDYFKTYDGVIEPIDSWDFDETEGELLNITHTVSCKGFNTSSGANNAFLNARRFVNSRTGYQNMVNPHFICKNTYPNFYPCLDSFEETIDRVNGSYSIKENYVSDLQGTGFGVLRYSVDLASGIEGFSSAIINGNIDGCKNGEMSVPRSRFKSFSPFNVVADFYSGAFGFIDLNPEAVSSGVNEDSINKKINFNIQYNNDWEPDTIKDIKSNIVSGDGFISVSINGSLKAKGDIRSRYQKISGLFDEINLFEIANDYYIDFLNQTPTYPLNPKAESSGVLKDKFTPVISFRASFTNKEIPPSGFESFSRNISFKPSLRRIASTALFDQNGTYNITDLRFDSRGMMTVQLNGQASPNETSESLVNSMKNEANLLLQKYGTTSKLKLEDYSVSTGIMGEYSLSCSWSFDTNKKVFDGTNYDRIDELELK